MILSEPLERTAAFGRKRRRGQIQTYVLEVVDAYYIHSTKQNRYSS